MKKYILSFLVIGTFGLYVLFQNTSNSDVNVIPTVQNILPTNKQINTKQKNVAVTQPKKISVTPIPANNTMYRDGTYTGISADAYYGNIQVEATIQNGQLTDVVFLDYPQDRSNSRRINGNAMPRLKSEAIALQGSNVNTVSGATDSSGAFRQSLASALNQAKN